MQQERCKSSNENELIYDCREYYIGRNTFDACKLFALDWLNHSPSDSDPMYSPLRLCGMLVLGSEPFF